jgi:hypothetical protein
MTDTGATGPQPWVHPEDPVGAADDRAGDDERIGEAEQRLVAARSPVEASAIGLRHPGRQRTAEPRSTTSAIGSYSLAAVPAPACGRGS